MQKIDLSKSIRTVPDFPKPGILFYDITSLLQDKKAFKSSIDALAEKFKKEKIDYVIAAEARGFIFGSVLAYKLGAGFVPVRKKGKLPWKTRFATYSLEYGTDTLYMHEDAIKAGSRVLVVDDLLATGGTIKAVCELVEQLGGKILSVVFLIELVDLKGRDKLKDYPVFSLLRFHGA